MLVTTGIDIYTVGSRILYCGFKHIGRKKRNTKDVFKKRQLGSKSKHHAEKNVAHLKTKCHL